MEFESQWPGDAIAAPSCPAYNREDAFFEALGCRSWNRVDSRADQADADPWPASRQGGNTKPGDAAPYRGQNPVDPSYAGQGRAAPSHAWRPREAMSPAGAHGSSRSLHFLPSCGRECAAGARSAVSERPGRRSTTER
jgi:hypothetical protein